MPKTAYIASLLIILLICTTAGRLAQPSDEAKINGISWVGQPSAVSKDDIATVDEVNANWLALMPYAFNKGDVPNLQFDQSWQWWGETTIGIKTTALLAKQQGKKVMIKPQVWIMDGQFTGHLHFDNETEWLAWQTAYSLYILHFAQVAEEVHAEIFCIGTEWTNFVHQRPAYWQQLIVEVKKVYHGKLTYASNWDAYQTCGFWDKLDYVGIDAYFPLSANETPSVPALLNAWDKHYDALCKLHQETSKAILFTEYGYRSVNNNTHEPWQEHPDAALNFDAQNNAYEAQFQKFWREDWFAGGFLWKWHPNHKTAGGTNNGDFTPQNKPVQQLIKSWYNN